MHYLRLTKGHGDPGREYAKVISELVAAAPVKSKGLEAIGMKVKVRFIEGPPQSPNRFAFIAVDINAVL